MGTPRSRSLTRGRRVLLLVAVAAAILMVDQLSKQAMRVELAGGGRTLIPGVLDLTLVENSGAAFSLGEGSGLVFIAVAIAIAVGALVWVWRDDATPTALVVTLGCVVGGGLGNMVDRIVRGTVTDFLATTFMSFPVFNVADAFITCGVVASFVIVMVMDARRQRAEADDGSAG